jgi:hypothetical protein
LALFLFNIYINRAYEADISQAQNEKRIFSTGVNKILFAIAGQVFSSFIQMVSLLRQDTGHFV